MHHRHLALISFVALVAVAPAQSVFHPSPKELVDDYTRANTFQRRAENAAFKLTLTPNWFGGHYLWYRNDLTDRTKEFVLVDADTGQKRPAFDHKRLAEGIAKATGDKVEADKLPFDTVLITDDLKHARFRAKNKTWDADLTTYEVKETNEPGPPDGRRPARDIQDGEPRQTSPDGAYRARIQDGQVQVNARGTTTWTSLTTTGSFTRVDWSPDSKHLIAFHLIPGDRKPVYLLKSSVPGTTRAVLESRLYDQPGDKLDQYEPYILDASTPGEKRVPIDPIMGGGQPWSSPPGVQWWKNGANAICEFPIRGYQEHKVIEIGVADAQAKTLIDEKVQTFIDQGNVMLRVLRNSHGLVWRSERDGWGQLYLYDTDSGQVRQITKGEWVVRSIDRIDEDQKKLWFTANGVAKDQDPYHIHYCRINFDGTGLLDMTPGDGTHTVAFSPDRKFYVDTYSRVDLAPVHELRRSEDGKLVASLEKGDIAALLKNGVKLPERFVAKGRDGQTDIWASSSAPPTSTPTRNIR